MEDVEQSEDILITYNMYILYNVYIMCKREENNDTENSLSY